jgi:hypothetical protein
MLIHSRRFVSRISLLVIPLCLPSLMLYIHRQHLLSLITSGNNSGSPDPWSTFALNVLIYTSICAALFLALDTMGMLALGRGLWGTARTWWSSKGWGFNWGYQGVGGYRDGVGAGAWGQGMYTEREPWVRRYGKYL